MLRTVLVATAALPLLAGCSTVPQPTTVPPVATDKARIIVYTAPDYKPIIAHGVRVNAVDVGRLNGPNQISIREVDPGEHVVDAIRAGMFGNKEPLGVRRQALQAGETWYLRVTEYGVNCRIVSEAETLIMSGIAGLIASKMIDGKERRQCDSYTPDLLVSSEETGRAAINEIVYGLADARTQLATASAASDGATISLAPTLDQVKSEWPMLEKLVARQVDSNLVPMENEFQAAPSTLRIYKYEPLETRATGSADEFGLVVRMNAEFRRSGSPTTTSTVRDMLFRIRRVDDSLVVAAPLTKYTSLADASSQAGGAVPDRAALQVDWPAMEKVLRRHFERNATFYEGAFDAVPSSVQVYKFDLADTLPSQQPQSYRMIVRVTAGFHRNGYRVLSSTSRDLLFEMQHIDNTIAVTSAAIPKATP
jgi:hypothetical protein